MSDDFDRRQMDEIKRLARLADPLREFKTLLAPHVPAPAELATRARDPLEQAQAQIKCLTDPLAHVPRRLLDENGENALAEQIKALTEPARDLADRLRDAQHLMAGKLEALLNPLQEAHDWLRRFQVEEQDRLRQWSTWLEDFDRHLRDLPDELRAQLAVLMTPGWCLDPNMPHTWGRSLTEAFQEGEADEAQQWLVDYFRVRLADIEQTLVGRHPTRGPTIADAFAAHREGRYRLSIPVLLSQADGVIHDRHPERQLFSARSDRNLQGVSSLPEADLQALFVAVFYLDHPLTRNSKLLPDDFDGLNRHAVLHGTDLYYGTEINSLRAVSILNFASYLVSEDAYEAAA